MSITGNLETMTLEVILQWASSTGQTGNLELERNKICKRIVFRDGRIVACSSDDPAHKLGQFLISRGKITKQTLRYALGQQKIGGQSLPVILEDMGVLSQNDIEEQIGAKAEEMIYGLFDWEDAIFRFRTDAPLDPYIIEVNLSADEILLKGAQRHDELQRIRQTFRSSGIVLRRTDRPLPADIQGGAMLFHVLELVGQQRTVADILMRTHASEYQVLKLLFTLHTRSLIEIVEEQAIATEAPTVLDVGQKKNDTIQLLSDDELLGEVEASLDASIDQEGPSNGNPDEIGASAPTEVARGAIASPSDLEELIKAAVKMIENESYEAALAALDACYRVTPDDAHLRRLILEAESAFLEQIRDRLLSPEEVPVRVHPAEAVEQDKLLPMERYIYGMIDGKSNIQSLVWVAPLREFEVMKTLQQMHDKGLIGLRQNGVTPAERALVTGNGSQELPPVAPAPDAKEPQVEPGPEARRVIRF